VGRGIRLTDAGRLLADRAAEIIGRVDAADAELSAHVGLTAGRVRLAGFSSGISTLMPLAIEALHRQHPGLEVCLIDTHPPEALELLRAGRVDVALVFRYDEMEPEAEGIRLVHVVDDPVYLLSAGGGRTIAELRDARWIAGCERCRRHLLALCADEGFTPSVSYTTDDMVAMQSLVAAGLGVTTIPGLALQAHRAHGLTATELKGADRHVYAATYGEPPDPPATAALLAALASLKLPGGPA
jgi:DNA-binding transcriptional LysR family regulator